MESFKTYSKLEERFSLVDSVNNDLIDRTIQESMAMVPVSQKWHFQTKNYSVHEALDEFYNNLKSRSDELAETWIGLGGNLRNAYTITLEPGQNFEEMKGRLLSFRNDLVSAKEEANKDRNLVTLEDQFNNTIQLVDKLAYMIGLE